MKILFVANVAKEHINKQIYENKAKIDVFDQLEWKWNEFIDYCWYTRLKYERNNPKYCKEDLTKS